MERCDRGRRQVGDAHGDVHPAKGARAHPVAASSSRCSCSGACTCATTRRRRSRREIEGGTSASPAAIAKVAREFHLDDSFIDRYGQWLGDAVQGDLGTSWFHRDQPVATEIKNRFPVTFSIAIGGILLSMLIGVPLGILAGTQPGIVGRPVRDARLELRDRDARLLARDPARDLAVAVNRHILPSSDYVNFKDSPSQWAEHLIMPWIALGLGGAAALMRQLRGAFIDTLDQDYIRTAHANGLKPRSIIGKHALKNAAMPAVTVLGIQIAYALGGTVVMERIFRPARSRPVRAERDRQRRHPGPPGRGDRVRGHVRVHEPARRHRVRVPQPEGPARRERRTRAAIGSGRRRVERRARPPTPARLPRQTGAPTPGPGRELLRRFRHEPARDGGARLRDLHDPGRDLRVGARAV